MLSMKDMVDTLKNSEVYDTRMEFRNLDYEQLLDKATGQRLLIDDLEKAHIENLNEVVDLEIKLEDMTSKYYLIKEKNNQLELAL